MVPLDPRFSRFAWHLRRWLLPITLLITSACSFGSPPPPTLQVHEPTLTPTQPRPDTATPSLPATTSAALPINPNLSAALALIQPDSLILTVSTLVDMHTRHVLSSSTKLAKGIAGARDWLLAEFTEIRTSNPKQPINVWTQDVRYSWNNKNIDSQNVVIVLQGTDVGAGVVLVGAHYDSITTNFLNGQTSAPGADENGSGIAALLESARIFAPQSHRATIMFVAFTGEETGRQGSRAFVKSYLQAQNPPIDLRAMINLDTIGSEIGPNGDVDPRTLRIFSAEPNDSPSRQLARQLALTIKTYLNDVDPVIQSAEERSGQWSDHQSFREAGYPAIRFIQGLEDVSRQRTPRDTLDNIQPGYLMRVTRAALVSVATLADGPKPPTDLTLRPKPDDPATQTLIWTPVQDAAKYLITLRQAPSLYYDQIFTVEASPTPELSWTGFNRFATVAIASIDTTGQMGPLSPEVSIASLLRQ